MRTFRILSFVGVGLLACNGAVSSPASEGGSAPAAGSTPAATTSPAEPTSPPSGSSTPASESPDVQLSPADMTRTWIELAVPQAEAPHIVQTSEGFVAITAEHTSLGRNNIGPTYNYLYRSADGITWTKLTPPPLQGGALVGIAYGAGRYVVATDTWGQGALVTSTDLAEWTTPALDLTGSGSPAPPDVQIVSRLKDRFYAMGDYAIFTSNDGVTFTTISDQLVQAGGIAFGNGVFMVAGHFSIQVSTDGLAWADHSPSCAIGPCVAVPGDAAPIPGLFGNVAFLDQFYVDQVSSTDGVSWQPYAGPTVNHVIGGYAFNTTGDPPTSTPNSVLRAWRAGESPQTLTVETQPSTATLTGGVSPAIISNPLTGGETCATNSCVIVGSALYLLR